MTLDRSRVTDQPTDRAIGDWSELGSLVLRAARRAWARGLVESAAQAGDPVGPMLDGQDLREQR